MRQNLIGPHQRMFADPNPGSDESAFQTDNTSEAYYKSPYYLKHKKDVQRIPPPRLTPQRMNLADVVGPAPITAIQAAKKIVFHAVGDTGAAKNNVHQSAGVSIKDEARVADAMVVDLQAGGADAPAFFFHLGDVVYNFGEGMYYYDQFYEPFRAYDRPIFAIPGNHDGMVFGSTSDVPQVPSLMAFLRNFCAPAVTSPADAGPLVRSPMTQPAAYFTLDAPFVSVIGLYSNVLESPGVISSQGGHYPIGDDQLTFLTAELTRLKEQRQAKERAVVIAVHHPPTSADSTHGGSKGLSQDIDTCCTKAGLWPDVILSGHAHLYQRFSRKVGAREIPYITAGSGGFARTAPAHKVPIGTPVGEFTLVKKPIVDFGYLTITVDMTANTLTVSFRSPGRDDEHDSVSVNL